MDERSVRVQALGLAADLGKQMGVGDTVVLEMADKFANFALCIDNDDAPDEIDENKYRRSGQVYARLEGDRVVVSLPTDYACTLRAICRRIAGDPAYTRREHTDELGHVLARLGISYLPANNQVDEEFPRIMFRRNR